MRPPPSEASALTRREALRTIALALAVLTGLGIVFYAVFVPTTLRVGVAPPGSEPAQFLGAFAEALRREKSSVRLIVTPFADGGQVSAALDGGRVELAILRSDAALPTSALGVATAHQNVVVLAARAGVSIDRLADLRGRAVGVLGQGAANRLLIARLAQLHGLAPGAITLTPFASPEDAAGAVAAGAVDALFAAAPRDARALAQAFHLLHDASEGVPTLVPLGDTAVLASRNPVFSADEIAVGEIASTPPWPAQATATLSFPTLIVARRNLPQSAVYEFTKQLFALRPALVSEYPAAARVEPLSTERGSPFAVHPGAVTYYDASEVGFLESYSDLLWLALFGFSAIASLAAWLFSLAFPKRGEFIKGEHAELMNLIDAARAAESEAALADIERRVDVIVADTSKLLFEGRIDAERQPAFDILIARLDRIIEARRGQLKAGNT